VKERGEKEIWALISERKTVVWRTEVDQLKRVILSCEAVLFEKM